MAHIQSFEFLSIKCVWSSNFIFIGIQLALLKLDLVAPLLEHQSPLLNNFETFFKKFNATFGDLNKEHMSSIKI
jgi:hypothetical protein